MPEADNSGLAYLIGSPKHHLHNLFKGPAAGYVEENTYFLPVACIVGFKLVLFSAAKYSSMGLPEYEYGPVYITRMPRCVM